MTRGLWITRALPFPMNTGDSIYTAGLVRAVADAGAALTVVGFPPQPADALPAGWPVRWLTVAGARHGTLRALASPLPLVAAMHATAAYRAQIEALADEAWDFVVFDQHGTGWALAPFLRRRRAGGPVLVHVAHDHEAAVSRALALGFRGSAFKRLGLWQNALKTGAMERRIVRSVDLVTAITDEDAAQFAATAPQAARVVLTPGYGGSAVAERHIDATVPRHVVMVGNYHWMAKAENLRQFVAAADAAFHAHGITLHVLGAMAPALAQELARSTRATVLHGYVADSAPHFAAARIAVVPEQIGGGFKLKFLDYIFSRVAVASLGHATAGLPEPVRQAMICRDDLPALVQAIVETIDDTERLSELQQRAYAAAQARYRWADRGRDLLAAVQRVASRRAPRTLHGPRGEQQGAQP